MAKQVITEEMIEMYHALEPEEFYAHCRYNLKMDTVIATGFVARMPFEVLVRKMIPKKIVDLSYIKFDKACNKPRFYIEVAKRNHVNEDFFRTYIFENETNKFAIHGSMTDIFIFNISDMRKLIKNYPMQKAHTSCYYLVDGITMLKLQHKHIPVLSEESEALDTRDFYNKYRQRRS